MAKKKSVKARSANSRRSKFKRAVADVATKSAEHPRWGTYDDLEVIVADLWYDAFAVSWGVPVIFESIWNGPPGKRGATGKNVIICNADSGVNQRHRLLQQRDKVIAHRSWVGGNSGEDDNGHGTMTATNSSGIRDDGDRIGVAPDSQLVVEKVFNRSGTGPAITRSMAKFAIDNGAHIFNYSGGGTGASSESYQAMEMLNEAGIIPFVSSGNAGPSSRNYPAYFDNTMSVGATQRNGTLAPFSTTNTKVDIAAPGMQVVVGNRSGGISLANGTSFSCPWMSGLAALVLDAHWSAGKPTVGNGKPIDIWRDFTDRFEGSDVDPHRNHRYGVPDPMRMVMALEDQLMEAA